MCAAIENAELLDRWSHAVFAANRLGLALIESRFQLVALGAI
jgi:hypothetical protein